MSRVAELLALAHSAHRAGDFQQAERWCREALQIDADDAQALYQLGEACQAQQRFREAADSLATAVRLRPDFAAAHNALGAALGSLGNLNAAADCFQMATKLAPDDVAAHYNRAMLAAHQNQLALAAESWQRVVDLQPQSADAVERLAVAYSKSGRFDEAAAWFRRALELQPDSAEATANLGTLLTRQGRIDEARECYRRALVRDPANTVWKLNLISLCPVVFHDLNELTDYRRRLFDGLEQFSHISLGPDFPARATAGSPPSFHLQFQGSEERPLREAYARLFRNCFGNESPSGGNGRPRLGLVVTSGHEGLFVRSLGGVINRLDTERFELTIFGSEPGLRAVRAAIHNPAVRLTSVVNRLPAFVQAIRDARLDVLYYWEVATDSVNYFLPFHRLAPAQCTSWGIQVTSGIPAVDCYLSSALVEPDDADAHYTERLVRAKTLLTYQERVAMPSAPKSRGEFGFTAAQHLYVCAQQLGKFHPDFDAILAGILRRDANAWIVTTEDRFGPAIGAQLRRRFAATLGDVAERVVFLPFLDTADYLSLLAAADVLLDPLHFGGVNSSYDGFSLNQPIVTWPSRFQRGRYTLACYRKMGLTDCVAADAEQYIDIAVRLGTNAVYREEVVAKIRRASPTLFEDAEAVLEHERIFGELAATARLGQRFGNS